MKTDIAAVALTGLAIAMIGSISSDLLRFVAIGVALALGVIVVLFVWVLRQEPRPKVEE